VDFGTSPGSDLSNEGDFSVISPSIWEMAAILLPCLALERLLLRSGIHGVDWVELRLRLITLVDRVDYRAELSDVIGEMVVAFCIAALAVPRRRPRDGSGRYKHGCWRHS